MRRAPLLLLGATWLTLGCGDGGSGPGPGPVGDGTRLAAQFERLADSVDAGGYSPAGEALRHAAEIVRLTGHATPVALTVDGTARSFLAVAEQIDFPNLVCTWPGDSGFVPPPDTITVPPPEPGDSTGVIPPDGGSGGGTPPDSVPIPGDSGVVLPPPGEPPEPECHAEGTYSMRTLIAWEPEHMAEVVRIVADVGSGVVDSGVPDVMTGLPSTVAADPSSPTTAPPDTAPGGGGGGGSGGWPGFMGEYLVRDVGSWYAVEGSQTNALEGITGACTDNQATIDWAEFGCEAARFRFEFSMTVDPANWERLTGVADPPTSPEGSHTLAMASNAVDGVRLTWVAWSPPTEPPEPGPGPMPIDSTGVVRPTSP
jgi:hypothetical protein